MSTPPLLEVRNLSFHYPDGRMALVDVTFTMQPGEAVALVGPNGAGKSTLLQHLNGVLPGRRRYEHHHHHYGDGQLHRHSDAPHIWVEGLAVTEPNYPEVRRRVGLLFQDPDDQLFCATVREDVSFGPRNLGRSPAESRGLAERALAAVGLSGFEDRLPHHLSFGERKRVCLAGILACEPMLLALDEPTSNLDPRGRRQFMAILQHLPAAKLIATHDLELVLELCARTMVLDGGEIFADGPTQTILRDERLLVAHGLEVPLSIQLGVPSARPREGGSRG
jgi:energy-coupling factor transporter ATP-binding protein EcfA2